VTNVLTILHNLRASLRRGGLDYVAITLAGSYPEFREPPPALPFPFSRFIRLPLEPSLEDLRRSLERVGQDSRIKGVVFEIGQLSGGAVAVQALRGMVHRLQAQGKHVVCWLPVVDTWTTLLAAACDQVFLPASALVFAPGLRMEQVFLRDTLALAGVEAEFEAFSEYKVSPDRFQRAAMTAPHREMLESILDSIFGEVVQGIAEGRGLEPSDVQALMERMPLSAQEAVEAGLADRVLYEDELATALGEDDAPVSLLTWPEARRWLRRPIRRRRRSAIGVISVQGLIVPGSPPPVPPLPLPIPLLGQMAGAGPLIQQLRAAERDRRVAAVVLYIDSPGGSSLASDLIWREVARLKQRKPVVALMGSTAASGGYYIAAPANAIVARSATLTGSIGVWGGKFAVAGLLERLQVGREVVQRGGRAGLYDSAVPFTEEEREAVRRHIGLGYAQFKARVADGRGLDVEVVEEIARGRVWTGRQALERGLVDELGGFETALRRAKELAGLNPEQWFPILRMSVPRVRRLPLVFPTQTGAWRAAIDVLRALGRERVWALPPWALRIADT
jgi:protease-4